MKNIKYFIFLLLAIPVAAIAQPSGSWPVSYGSSAPSYTPSGSGTRLYFNTATNELYTWQPAPTSAWIKYPKAFDQISGCAAPAYTPTARQSTFAANSCTPKPELYQYTGSSWACLNCYTDYVAGTGIDITGSTISNTGDLSTTNEIQDLSLSGQTLSLTSDASPVTLPVVGILAGTGIGVSSASGVFTITNSGDTNASDDITTSTTLGGDLSGTLPNPTVVRLQGRSVANTAPSTGEILKWNGSAWAPGTDAGASMSGHTLKDDGVSMTARTGANFISTSQINAALTDDAVGDETEIRFTILGDAITATEIAADAVGSSEIATDAVGSAEIAANAVGSSELASTAVTAGTYTNATVTFDADGRATSASSGTAPVTGSGTAGQIAYWNTSGTITGDANNTWDATNVRAKINTTTPIYLGGISGGGNFPGIWFTTATPSFSNYAILNDGGDLLLNTIAAKSIVFRQNNTTWASQTGAVLNLSGTVTTTGALGESAEYAIKQGTNLLSMDMSVSDPFLAVTNGTVRAFGAHASTVDGAVFGAYSNSPTTFRSGGNVNRFRLATSGGLAFGTSYYSIDPGLNNMIIQGSLGISTSAATQHLDVNGNARLRAALYDGTNSAGSSGNILTSTGSATQWKSAASVLAGSTYVPTGTSDPLGSTGDFSYDSNYIYVKTSAGWKRTALSTF